MPAYLSARGVEIGPLLKEVDLVAGALADPQQLIPLNSAAQVFALAAQRLGDPAFGISYAKSFPLGGTGLLGHLMLSSPTVRDVFHVVTRYLEIHMTQMRTRSEEDKGIGLFTFAWPSTLTAPMLHYTGFYLASLIIRLRRATGENWQPLSALFQHRAPEVLGDYRKFFGKRLKFDQAANGIAVDATTLNKPMPKVMEGLFESVLELGNRRLKEQATPEDVASALHARIAERLASGEPFDLEAVATAMNMPSRALQWRLEQEATTYEKVLLLTRVVLAEQYLRDSNHRLTKIANLLGFSELSAFTRWSQRQFKMTPSAYRKHLRASKL